ncbi:hypothetical protein [Candidatus Laterigemmans baculatus]|uniref:hypothetical protein n=1 Tax=Candidatus Laterigemmans baculatus TaxID=2770505 RepID=UPI00193BA0C8|nr:hypothetical protein [Candidatus Laterigemmans baculatus]
MSQGSQSLHGYTQQRGLGADRNPQQGVMAGEVGEGPLTRAIESQTSRLPSDFWLMAAGGSIAASLAYKMSGDDHKALFIGQWAPTFLILGLYNKMVKQHGS